MKNEMAVRQFKKYIAQADISTFIAMAHILCIHLFNEDNDEMRAFEEVWPEIINKFRNLKPIQQRQLLKVLRDAAAADKNTEKFKKRTGAKSNSINLEDKIDNNLEDNNLEDQVGDDSQ